MVVLRHRGVLILNHIALTSLRFMPALSFISFISCPSLPSLLSSALFGYSCIGFLFSFSLSFCGAILFRGRDEALGLGLDCLLEVRSCEQAAFRLSCPWAWNWLGWDGMRQDGMGGGRLHREWGGTHLRSSVLPIYPSLICVSDSGHADGDVPRDSVPETWMHRQKGETDTDGCRWDAGVGAGAVPVADRLRRWVHFVCAREGSAWDCIVHIQMR
ncbi:hypothetical protein B0H13DRAFT_528119 [Mycena leptocephala]|nr:hypothetical protein B0H13DRAFT_528119 [Mycena leptocephala]